ncbi:MAG: glycosyltransferase family 4 protein [Flavobacteriaceae bacterium]
MGKPLKIILIGPAPPFRGGISDTQVLLAEALQNEGHQVSLWSFTQQYPKIFFPGKTQRQKKNQSTSVPIRQMIHGFAPWQWLRISNLLKKEKADLIIFRYWTPFFAPCWAFLARRVGFKTIRLGLVDNWTPHENSIGTKYLNRFFANSMDAFMCLSPYVAQQLQKNTPKKVWWSPHPLPENLPPKKSKSKARKNLGWPQDTPTLVFAGLVREYKGLDHLIEACRFIRETRGIRFELRVGGAFYSPITPYQKQIRAAGLESSVHLNDAFLSPKELRDYICAASLLVLPYKRGTQSGIIAQGIYYNTPLLVTNIGGLAEQIQDYPKGFVVESSAKALAQGIEKILENKSQKDNSWATEHPNWKTFAQTLLAGIPQ